MLRFIKQRRIILDIFYILDIIYDAKIHKMSLRLCISSMEINIFFDFNLDYKVFV